VGLVGTDVNVYLQSVTVESYLHSHGCNFWLKYQGMKMQQLSSCGGARLLTNAKLFRASVKCVLCFLFVLDSLDNCLQLFLLWQFILLGCIEVPKWIRHEEQTVTCWVTGVLTLQLLDTWLFQVVIHPHFLLRCLAN